MTTAIKRRRGTTAQHSTFTGLEGELTVDTTKETVVVHDGATAGGFPLLREDLANNTAVTTNAGTQTLTNKTLTAPVISGGSINNTPIGASTASTGSFTTLATSGAVTHNAGTANGVTYLNGSKVLTSGSALTFDGSNLGLGVTPSAWITSFKALDINTIGGVAASGTTAQFLRNSYFDGTNYVYKTTSTAERYQQGTGGHAWYTAPSGTAGNAITFTQAMTLDAGGRLLVGTTAQGTYGGNTVEFRGANIATLGSNVTGNLTLFTTDAQAANVGAVLSLGGVYAGTTPYAFGAIAARKSNGTSGNAQGYLQFYTTNSDNSISEKLRIDSGGYLLVGTTSVIAGNSGTQDGVSVYGGTIGRVVISANNDRALELRRRLVDGQVAQFFRDTTQVGNISVTTTATSYVTSSDYRLKNTIAPMTGALAKVALLKPVTYKWNADGSDGEGFIAHELAEVVPQCVTGEKDAVDAEGNPQYQGIDTSFLVATLTAAIQELKAEFDAYKASHP